MTWLGLDIGGANLKAADGQGWARSVPFPLWREPGGLATALRKLIASAPATGGIAATMTGELCDAFRTKADGVRHIIASVADAAKNRNVRIYLVDGRIVSAAEAELSPQLAAASNWHVLARFAGHRVPNETALLIDIGSTTADVIPLIDGQPRTRGLNDTDRLLAGELVYAGVGRTPVCALTDWLPYRDTRCPVAVEIFAATADAYVTLGDLPEEPNCTNTADGRPLTKEFCCDRLARMICADSSTFGPSDAIRAAAAIRDAQLGRLYRALERVVTHMRCVPSTFVLSGAGEFLAAQLLGDLVPPGRVISLAREVGIGSSECGPAFALAVLAAEMHCELSR